MSEEILSVSMTFCAVLGPLLTTFKVYVIWFPAITGSGLALLVIAISAKASIPVIWVSVLLDKSGSGVSLLTVTVLVIVVFDSPFTVPLINTVWTWPLAKLPMFKFPVWV